MILNSKFGCVYKECFNSLYVLSILPVKLKGNPKTLLFRTYLSFKHNYTIISPIDTMTTDSGNSNNNNDIFNQTDWIHWGIAYTSRVYSRLRSEHLLASLHPRRSGRIAILWRIRRETYSFPAPVRVRFGIVSPETWRLRACRFYKVNASSQKALSTIQYAAFYKRISCPRENGQVRESDHLWVLQPTGEVVFCLWVGGGSQWVREISEFS